MTVDQLQSPYWKPIYAQPTFFARDELETKIFPPGKVAIPDQIRSRIGFEEDAKMNYFKADNEEIGLRKQRYPFLYDFFPHEEEISLPSPGEDRV